MDENEDDNESPPDLWTDSEDDADEWCDMEESNVTHVCADPEDQPQPRKRRRISPLSLWGLKWLALIPVVLIPLVSLLPPSKFDIDTLELFSGCQSATQALRGRGLCGAAFDVNLGPGKAVFDLSTGLGFSKALELLNRVRPGGLVLGGPPCSSYVWMNRSTSGRSTRRPLGYEYLQYIRQANLVAARVMLLLAFAACRGVMWLIEQPGSSLLSHIPRFRQLKRAQRVFYTKTHLGMFEGGSTAKATRLWSSHSWVGSLYRKLEPDLLPPAPEGNDALTIKHGDGRVSGGPGLKNSQHWPKGFGSAIADAYLAARASCPLNPTCPHAWLDYTRGDSWPDARLSEAIRAMKGITLDWPELPQ